MEGLAADGTGIKVAVSKHNQLFLCLCGIAGSDAFWRNDNCPDFTSVQAGVPLAGAAVCAFEAKTEKLNENNRKSATMRWFDTFLYI